MYDQTKECWFQLCQLAAVEHNSAKLMALVEEINRLLEQKEHRLKASRSGEMCEWNSDEHQDEARQPYRSREGESADEVAEGLRLFSSNKCDSEKESE